MTKFRCIKGSANVPVGTIIVGELEGERICLTEDSTVKDNDNNPYFEKGELVPLTGYVWQWESCEGEPDKEELLERFEDAVANRALGSVGMAYETPQKLEEEYQKAKAEMLTWLSYIP